MKTYDVAIIGAGTAGLAARREVAKLTDNYIVVDDGPMGTTCARVGCMPSKVLIEVARMWSEQAKFAEVGISGSLKLDSAQALKHVRKLRDRFVRSVTSDLESWIHTKLIAKRARFKDAHTLDLGDELISAKSIVIATGSRPVFPKSWTPFQDLIVTSDQIFELDRLPKRIAVIGLGVIGLELGQALHRLGVEVVAIGMKPNLAGIGDPDVQAYAWNYFSKDMKLVVGAVDSISRQGQELVLSVNGETINVDLVLAATGRKSNLDQLGLDTFLTLNAQGLPNFDPATLKVADLPLYVAGDTNMHRPILHEASDQGRIAGYNAVRDGVTAFVQRTKLNIVFTNPGIAAVGASVSELAGEDYIVGRVSFEGQGRAIIKLNEKGLARIYARRRDGKLLGAELFAPDAEHLAHLLSWAIQMEMTVDQALQMPFYHPVLEEGLRTALRDLAQQVAATRPELEIKMR